MPKPDGPQFKQLQLFNDAPYKGASGSPTTYTDQVGRKRITSTSVLPEWWQDVHGDEVDPEFNSPHDIMDSTRHIRGVEGDFVVIDPKWDGEDRSSVIWHGSLSKITDDKVSPASAIGQTYRYDGMVDPDSLKEFRQGKYHDADKVWGGTWRIAKDYATGGREGYMYGLDVRGDVDVTMDGYAFDDNEIVRRYRLDQ